MDWLDEAEGRLDGQRLTRPGSLLDDPVSQQAIAPAWDGLQQFPVGAERLSDGRDMKLKRVVLDVGALPNPTDEVALADEFPS